MEDETRADVNTLAAANKARRYTFFGSYDHAIDAKGRIIIPNAYRKALGDNFAITIDLDDRAIAIYPEAGFEEMMDELCTLNRRRPSVQLQQDHIAKFSYPGLQADNQGRVLLPVKLRQYVLGDAKDVEISGARDHIRIVKNTDGLAEDIYYKEHRDEIRNDIASLEE